MSSAGEFTEKPTLTASPHKLLVVSNSLLKISNPPIPFRPLEAKYNTTPFGCK